MRKPKFDWIMVLLGIGIASVTFYLMVGEVDRGLGQYKIPVKATSTSK